MAEIRKKDRRDKKHGWYVRNQDSMHIITPYVMPGRTRNEAVLSEDLDLTALMEFIKRKNEENPVCQYSWFQAICAAIAKVFILRPKMNYYISGYRLYEHKEITLAFVIKRDFSDDGPEHLAKIEFERTGDSPLKQAYDKITEIVSKVRGTTESEGITKKFDFYQNLPRPIFRLFVGLLRLMEYFGDSPDSIKRDDPSYSSIFVSNLGSIRMNAEYHHLSEWGDNSFFVVLGERKKRPFFDKKGNYEMRESVHLSMTIDERIADGFYFAKSIKMMNFLIQNPLLLELPAEAPIGFE